MALRGFYRTYMVSLSEALILNMPPGPPVLPARYIINAFKAGTLPMFFGLMWWYGNFTLEAHVITALHGGYGICWFLKDIIMGDPFWRNKATIASCAITAFGLIAYWSSGFIVISQRVEASPLRVMVAILLGMVGTVVMMVSDAQK
jgi:hypothetical protein